MIIFTLPSMVQKYLMIIININSITKPIMKIMMLYRTINVTTHTKKNFLFYHQLNHNLYRVFYLENEWMLKKKKMIKVKDKNRKKKPKPYTILFILFFALNLMLYLYVILFRLSTLYTPQSLVFAFIVNDKSLCYIDLMGAHK